MARFALAGLFFVFVVEPQLWAHVFAAILFAAAGLTDWVDGWIARKTKTTSAFGAFADPLADKLLVVAALIAFLDVRELAIPAWVIFLTIARELIIGSLRSLAGVRGTVLAADRWGKWKMGVQTGCILAILLLLAFRTWLLGEPGLSVLERDRLLAEFADWPRYLSYLLLAATWASGIRYLYRHRKLLEESWG